MGLCLPSLPLNTCSVVCGRKVVIGAASRVRYSVTVVALTAEDANAVLEERIDEARRLQIRQPILMKEMEALKVR